MIENIMEANKKMLLLRRSIMRHMLSQYGLHPGQPEMLCYVQMHPGCLQRQIAEDAGVSAASIAASFKRMENAGLIRRRSDTADLRCKRVDITERGESAIQACMEETQRINHLMLWNLDDEEMTVLLRCLSKINQNLSQVKDTSSISSI